MSRRRTTQIHRALVDQAMLGTYVPGRTWIHRLGPGWKMLALIAIIISISFIFRSLPVAIGACAAAAVCYVIIRVPWRTALSQLLPPLPVLVFFTVFTGIFEGWYAAFTLLFVLYACIAFATIVTLTTPVARMLDSLDHALAPLRRFHVPTESITLVLVLTIRLIPVQLQAFADAVDAARARGAGFSTTAVLVPVLVRSIRRSQQLGDALVARGVGDD
ncbi:cobalt ABC transporter permease [Corynebacterium sp. 13CS0277]|uniref:energy-coupling factor transporter transmembrane component T family protein n=1 Tax=Corynebacterium sp. 13CS0277 TaxID=2071994 RepID=UPI000D030FE2|nr:energy-coupling factor transporter transmembrane protein EcfT [Corynebacterium sp. 13CS0277]PRQ10541.1 cobalt ABC transporter permease [Corynebacterium sp. 13CS0277]